MESLLCHFHSGKFQWPKYDMCGAEAGVRSGFVSQGKLKSFSEPQFSVMQSEVSQKEKNKYRIFTHIWGI